ITCGECKEMCGLCLRSAGRAEPVGFPARPKGMQRRLPIAVILLAITGTAACGTQPGGSPGASASGGSASAAGTSSVPPVPGEGATGSQSGSPAPTGAAALTEADNGATVRLSPGQMVTVVLAPRGMFAWHIPATSGTAVRRTSADGGYPGRRPA